VSCTDHAYFNLDLQCICEPDWSDIDCSFYEGPCIDGCASCSNPSECHSCVNNAEMNSKNMCECKMGWLGKNCETYVGK